MTSVAAQARAAVRDDPFLHDALRAGVLNYTAAAEYVDVDGDVEATATALRRYGEELSPIEEPPADVRVSMESGVGSDGAGDPLLSVGGRTFGSDGRDFTAILAAGSVDAALLRRTLGLLLARDVSVEAAGVSDDALVVVVERRAGADALRAVESALAA